jgi:hypothetical protein
MKKSPALGAGCGNGAMHLGKRRTQNTKRHADPITFYLPIDDKYRLTADERCWRIEQHRKDGEWRPIEYHFTLEAVVNSLSGRLLRTSKVCTLADALDAVENVARKLTHALAPQYRLEQSSGANKVHSRR